MSTFQTLFNLTVKHEFYADGVCACLDFVPTDKTRKIIINAGLVFKKTHAGIVVAYNQDKREALTMFAADGDEDFCFEFKVYAKDPDFRSYTAPFSADASDILYFDNLADVAANDINIRLHETEYVSKIKLVELDSIQVKDILSQKDRLIPPVFVVKISASGSDQALFDNKHEPIARDYYLHFNARQTFWKYYLLGVGTKGSAFIVDSDNRVEFEATGQTALPDKRVALTFRSKQSIPLGEKSDYRFQLRENRREGEKVLIKRLPVAQVSGAGKEVVAEKGMVVSEIYINY